MDQTLQRIVEHRVLASRAACEEWALLVVAPSSGPAGGSSTVATRPATPPEPAGAYLSSITVEGFRGIGARAHLVCRSAADRRPTVRRVVKENRLLR